ncbi:MAG: hypothetical protein M3457_00585 [Chloroflexota bacterium]|nr:hypothetical protein [Chloroflexota bacterium]
MSDEQRKSNTPLHPVRPSATQRHELNRIKPNTAVKRVNSVALPEIDTRAEIAGIQQGHGQRVGDSRYQINGRVYVGKPNGATYPENGDGIVQLTRLQFRALRLPIKHEGRTVDFDQATEKDPDITQDDISVALDVFLIRERS